MSGGPKRSGGARSGGGRSSRSSSGGPQRRTAKGTSGGRSRGDGSGTRGAGGGRSSAAGRGGTNRSGVPRRSGAKQPRKKPAGLDGTQVEGRQAVRELLLAGRRNVTEVFLSNEAERVDIVEDIVGLAEELHVPIRAVSRSKLDHMARTEAPQGVVAMAQQLPAEELGVLCRNSGGGRPFLLALDGVTDPGNLGAVMRIAECAGVTGVVLPRHRAAHVTPTVTKAAAGAIEYLSMSLVGGLPAAIEEMRSLGVWVVGLDSGGATSIHDLPVADEPVCLVLGAEGKGLSKLVSERCDVLASIPLHGRLASLNVASAGAVACYEVARRRSQGSA